MYLDDFDKWFVGFFDGEGYFNIMTNRYKKKNGDISVRKTFRVAISVAEDDYQTLLLIQKQYGGNLSVRKKQNAFPNAQKQWTWYTTKENFSKVISKLEFLKTPNKKERYEKFIKELDEYIN